MIRLLDRLAFVAKQRIKFFSSVLTIQDQRQKEARETISLASIRLRFNRIVHHFAYKLIHRWKFVHTKRWLIHVLGASRSAHFEQSCIQIEKP